MDLVLEFFDSFGLDYVYSRTLPASLASHIPSQWQQALSLSQGNLSSVAAAPVSGDIYGYAPYLFKMSEYTGASLLPRYNVFRQALSLLAITTVFGWLLYLAVASFSYIFIFDKAIFNHPRYLKNQMSLEIKQAMTSIPGMVALTVPWFLLELQGMSKLYMKVDTENHGIRQLLLEYVYFLMFTDCGIYLLHRWLHWPRVYKALHKPHHKWLVTTPYASHAFHPVDGYFQSLPYHIYPMIFPLNKVSYLILFTFVNFWTVMIHDGEYLANDPVVNGAACHTVHHLYFNYNYGQFTTLWDRLGGTYREPDRELFNKSLKQSSKTWEEQVKKMEVIKQKVEGDKDDRVYGTEERLKKNA
ncbi:LAME_0A06964g1_1 [Lachancea meyersii CBS 8951]|uniref:LAME_0A06964g1_1 n=1 Tax=Lachancea meyersii CBS 8951 TaxID=1266667 RepID=A0A1G4IQJ0_9SACH|nr:LAME_0A06964g1_1 [Lachancea meyersii CBS 8951]